MGNGRPGKLKKKIPLIKRRLGPKTPAQHLGRAKKLDFRNSPTKLASREIISIGVFLGEVLRFSFYVALALLRRRRYIALLARQLADRSSSSRTYVALVVVVVVVVGK